LDAGGVRVESLDTAVVRVVAGSARTVPDSISIVALTRGLGRVTATAGGWRADTAFVPIGRSPITLIDERFEAGLRKNVWRVLGDPPPVVATGAGSAGSAGLVARSDREWESGVLSRSVFPVRSGLSAGVWVSAPFAAAPAVRSFVIALVAADPEEVVDSAAPHFLRLAALSWVGEANRISYAVGREQFTEPLSRLGSENTHRVKIEIAEDRAVLFFVDDTLRWKSTAHVVSVGANSRAQLWLGSQSVPSSVIFDDVILELQPPPLMRRR